LAGRLARLREAGPDDAGAIARVHTAAWEEAYRGLIPARVISARAAQREWQWEIRLAKGAEREHVVVAEIGDELVGFASGGPTPDEDMDPEATAEVTGLYVGPGRWRQGIGGALLTELLDRLRRDGFGSATLWVLAGNASARSFYEAAGWKLEGAERRHPERRALEVRYSLERLLPRRTVR
jgi:GNAT superfamily N-acetyltransferase